MACVLPLHAVASNSLTISSRQRTETFCFWTVPCAFRTEIAAVRAFHSIRPSHKDSGGLSGSVSPISYRQAFWLLEPELSTRIFIPSSSVPSSTKRLIKKRASSLPNTELPESREKRRGAHVMTNWPSCGQSQRSRHGNQESVTYSSGRLFRNRHALLQREIQQGLARNPNFVPFGDNF